MIYEIQDLRQTFFRVYEPFEAVKIYDTNWLRDKHYEEKYNLKKEDKYKIPKWIGELRFVAIVEVFLNVTNNKDKAAISTKPAAALKMTTILRFDLRCSTKVVSSNCHLLSKLGA